MYASFKAVEPLYTFPQFLAFCEQLVAEGRTSGPNQSEFLIFFTKLNYQRMVRWNRTAELLPETVLAVQKAPAQQWFVITEAWCGDSAQNLPLNPPDPATFYSQEAEGYVDYPTWDEVQKAA